MYKLSVPIEHFKTKQDELEDLVIEYLILNEPININTRFVEIELYNHSDYEVAQEIFYG